MNRKNRTIIIKYVISPLVMGILIFILYRQLINQQDLVKRWAVIMDSWKSPWIYVVFLLMFVNWGIEAYKWKKLVAPLQTLPFSEAFFSVLSGCSITMLTPNRTGEFVGRISWLQPANRINGIAAAMVGSLSQLLITFFMGLLGFCFLFYLHTVDPMPISNPYTQFALVFIIMLLCFFLFFMYMNPTRMLAVFNAFAITRKWVAKLEVLTHYQGKDLLRILSWSFLRYSVFILQYVLVLKVFIPEGDVIELFILTTVFYLLVTLAPTVGLLELPVRAGIGVMLYGWVTDNVLGIEIAAFVIWLINLMIPSLLGTLMIGYSINKMAEE